MQKAFLIAASISGFLAVAIGAFGAHALKSHFNAEPNLREIFETGSRYHFYHTIVLLFVAVLAERYSGTFLTVSGSLFIAGIILFSGSLYILAISGVKTWGAVTPIGGVAFLGGWACLAGAILKA